MHDFQKTIISSIKKIEFLEESIRNYINTGRYQTILLSDLDSWNQICSSLDTLDDTFYSILDYIRTEYPENIGLKYIYTYGILQALFIQQDAIKNLSEAFKIKFEISEKLKNIRSIRNASIGHPTKNNVKKRIYSNYIARFSLSKGGFTLLKSSKENRTEMVEVNLMQIIDEQLVEIETKYEKISQKLIEADKMHKKKYKDNLLADTLPQTISYYFQKVGEGINSNADESRNFFALSMLNLIEKSFDGFKKKLNERNELNEYILHDLTEYYHGIKRLERYLKNDDLSFNTIDANIYYSYLYSKYKHFIEIAKEIDEEYSKNLKD